MMSMGKRAKAPRSKMSQIHTCLALVLFPLGVLVGYQAGLSACGNTGEDSELTPMHVKVGDTEVGADAQPISPESIKRKGGPVCDGERPAEPRKDIWVFRNSNSTRYTHMPMLEKLDNGTLVAAWQASDSVEGSMSQRIELSVNLDGQGQEWSTPSRLHLAFKPNISQSRSEWDEKGGQWGPVLHNDGNGHLWLFYSESHGECIRPSVERLGVKRYIIGGDIKVARMHLDTGQWSNPVVLYSQNVDNYIPKVTANKLVVLSTGEWVLPFWREKSASVCKSGKGTRTSAGVLITADQGRTWEGHALLSHSHSWLIENSVVELESGNLMMYFRTSLGWVFQSRSMDKGRTWGLFEALNLPNPDSKVHVLALPSNVLLIAFNDHPKFPGAWAKIRTHLRVGLSQDEGHTWHRVLTLSEDMTPGMRFAYPTMLVKGCSLFVMYSVTYERCIAHCNSDSDTELLPAEDTPNVDQTGMRMTIFDLGTL